jgi:hypothetical protein
MEFEMDTTPAVDTIVSLFVAGLGESAIRSIAGEKLGMTPEALDSALADAKRRLTLAATVNRDEEIGKAKAQLEDLYAKAVAAGDLPTAASVRKELSRMLGLGLSAASAGKGTAAGWWKKPA